jgi:hypothetical protein
MLVALFIWKSLHWWPGVYGAAVGFHLDINSFVVLVFSACLHQYLLRGVVLWVCPSTSFLVVLIQLKHVYEATLFYQVFVQHSICYDASVAFCYWYLLCCLYHFLFSPWP